MVISGYISAGPTIFTKLQHTVVMAATPTRLGFSFNFLSQSQPGPTGHANSNPQGHHLHWPWQWAGTSHTDTSHACAWHNPYKRAGSPNPLLTFWLGMTQVTSRSRHLSQTLARWLVHSTLTIYLIYSPVNLHLSTHSPAVAWQPHVNLKLVPIWQASILASY